LICIKDWNHLYKDMGNMGQKKIWLTGSRGFIGRPLVKAVRGSQADLTCLTQDAGKGNSASTEDIIHLNFRATAEIEDKVKFIGLPDILIHLGWGEMTSPESPLHLKDNVQIGKNLVETLFRLGLKKFIFIGSMNQYGSRTGLLSEDMEPQGRLTNYAKAKNEVEQLGFQAAQKYGKIFISVRTFYVFGAGQRQGSLINDLFQAHLKGTDVSLSPCEHYRDYIHVRDVVEGIQQVCAIEQSTIVNLGSGQVVKVKDFVVDFWKNLGGDTGKLKFGMRPLLPGEPEQPKSYADLGRLIRLTQWQPKRNLQEGIIITIEELSNE